MGRYIVAVSGGVDSMVLLHMLVASGEHELLVAHFDHGIRPDSADDARFVAATAQMYGLHYVSEREELGVTASEELARQRRYAFLRKVAAKHDGAVIATAHHADDIAETIAINLLRGTGWRGLAVMGAHDVMRPLLSWSKQKVYEYAVEQRLEWVEDSTNHETVYLRNRVRRVLDRTVHKELLALQQQQVRLKQEIQSEVAAVLPSGPEYARYVLIMAPPEVASELLQAMIVRHIGAGLTRPQRQQALLAIKTAQPGAEYQAGGGVTLHFTKQHFVVKTG